MPITDLLERNSKLYGDEICLVEMNPDVQEAPRVTWKEYELIQPTAPTPYVRQITWGVFDEKANRVANLLLSRGIRKGQKVAVLLMNCLEWLPIYFGILKTGAIAVPLNFRYTADEIEYCLKLADADVLFFGPEFIGRVEEIVDSIGQERVLFYVGQSCPSFAESYNDATANCSSSAPKILVQDTDEAAIYYSSGTTGFPKAILLDHTALLQSARMEAVHHETTHDDVFLCIPPLYHTGAKMHWFGSLYTGGKAVLLKSNSPKAILEAVTREGCTIVWLLVPWCQDLLAALDRGELKLENYQLSQWRLMHIGAQPVPPSLIKRWMEYFPNHKYDTNYGLSESTGPGCVHLGLENIRKVGAIGVPGFGWKCKIVDEQDTPVQQGDVGELCVKGPGVMRCYYHDPKATEEVLKDGWLHTGDMAMQDPEGFIFPCRLRTFCIRIRKFMMSRLSDCPTRAWAKSPPRLFRRVRAKPVRKPKFKSSAWICRATSGPARLFSPTCRAIPRAKSRSPNCAKSTAQRALSKARTRADNKNPAVRCVRREKFCEILSKISD